MEASGQLHAPAALPRGNKLRYPLDSMLGGPQSRLDAMAKRKISAPASFTPLHRWVQTGCGSFLAFKSRSSGFLVTRIFPWRWTGQKVKCTTLLHLVLMLRMYGALRYCAMAQGQSSICTWSRVRAEMLLVVSWDICLQTCTFSRLYHPSPAQRFACIMEVLGSNL